MQFPGTMLNMALQGIAGKTAHGRTIATVPLAGAAPGIATWWW